VLVTPARQRLKATALREAWLRAEMTKRRWRTGKVTAALTALLVAYSLAVAPACTRTEQPENCKLTEKERKAGKRCV